jgi:hypothetical protein
MGRDQGVKTAVLSPAVLLRVLSRALTAFVLVFVVQQFVSQTAEAFGFYPNSAAYTAPGSANSGVSTTPTSSPSTFSSPSSSPSIWVSAPATPTAATSTVATKLLDQTITPQNLGKQGIYGNYSCIPRLFTAKEASTIVEAGQQIYVPPTYIDKCTATTNMGEIDQDGWMQAPTDNLMSKVNVNGVGFIPFGNNKLGLLYNYGAGVAIRFYESDSYDSTKTLDFTDQLSHIKFYNLATPTTSRLTHPDIDKTPLDLDYESITFSSNRQWLTAVLPGRALLRINTTTNEVLAFGPALSSNAFAKYTISNDGRYVAVLAKQTEVAKVYDLSTCNTQPAQVIYDPVAGCGVADLSTSPSVQALLSTIQGVSAIRFIADNSQITAYLGIPGSAVLSIYSIQADGTKPANGLDYLAMGDSFASGEGAGSYITGTDDHHAPKNLCHTSSVSYPYNLISSLGYTSFSSLACSGAVMDNIDDYIFNSNVAQFKDSGRTLEYYVPGNYEQINYYSRIKPKNTTLMIGGNDIAFDDKIIDCILSLNCYSKYEERVLVNMEIEGLYTRLYDLYTNLRSQSPSTTIAPAKQIRVFC